MYVITGTSGTGKSTLVAALVARGYDGFEEPVRKTLRYHLSIDGPALPSKNPTLFIETMLSDCRSDFERASMSDKVSFFDRGIPDLIAYANRFGVSSPILAETAKANRYNQNVFLLPPWEGIFQEDEFRKASFSEYRDFHKLIVRSYTDFGYNLIEVPCVSNDLRVAFIEASISKLA